MLQFTATGKLNVNPDVKKTASGETYVVLFIGCKQRSGDYGSINVSVFGKQAEFAAQYLQKGSRVAVAGNIQINDKYTNYTATTIESTEGKD